jgi:hypothetical protein
MKKNFTAKKMEADTIQKNAASPKSQKSRGNMLTAIGVMKKIFLLYIMFCMASIANAQYQSSAEKAVSGNVSAQIELGRKRFVNDDYKGAVLWFTYNGQKTKDAWKHDRDVNSMMGRMYYYGGNSSDEYQSGNLIKGIKKWDDNTDITTYKRDVNGNITEEYSRNTKGNVDGKAIYKYDNNGNMIECEYFQSINKEPFEPKRKYVGSYDNQGNIIEDKWFYEGSNSFSIKSTFLYNSEGNCIETIYYEYYGGTKKWSYKYKMDSRGNWIECISSCTNGEKDIFKREIEYY